MFVVFVFGLHCANLLVFFDDGLGLLVFAGLEYAPGLVLFDVDYDSGNFPRVGPALKLAA